MRKLPLVLTCVLSCATRSLLAQELPLDSLLRITVSASAKYAQTVSEAAASVTIITAEDIRRHGYRTLDEIMSRVPGYYTTYDRNYAYVGVRGFSRPGDYNNRVLVLLDGHTLNEGVFGSVSVGTDLALDPDVIDHVEVINGPGSALYGTGAMLTSINIVTLRGRQVDGVRATAGAGPAGLWHAAAIAGGVIGRQTEVTLAGEWTERSGQDLYFPEYDDSATNRGVSHGLDWDRHHSVLFGLNSGGWGVSAFAGTRSKGIPTGAFGVDFDDHRARTMDEHRLVELRYATARSGTMQLNLRGFAKHYGYAGTYPYAGEATFDAAADDAIGGEVRLRWDLGSRQRLLVGTEYTRHFQVRYHSWLADSLLFDRNAPFGVFSAYAQDELQLTTNLSVVLGLRHDVQGASHGSTSPRLAVLYHPAPRTTLKLLYGEAFRTPSMYELTFYGSRQSSGLRPERIRTYEAVWEQRMGPSVFGSASLYHYRMRDLIDTRVDPADSLIEFSNLALATSSGITLALNARFPGGTSAYLSYGYQVTRDGTTQLRLSNSPQHLVKGGAAAPIGPHLLLSGEARYESARQTVYATTSNGHLWTGMQLILSPGSLSGRQHGALERTEFSINVANMLDTRYATPGAFEHLQPTLPQDGRAVQASMRIRF